MQNAMGHEFGSTLICPCGVSLEKHQGRPKPCRKLKGARRPYTASDDVLARYRVALGIPMNAIAAGLGVSVPTVQRAVNGQIGGKGCTRQAVRDQVAEFLGADTRTGGE